MRKIRNDLKNQMLTLPQYIEENDEHLVLFEKFCFIVV
jgi:hypothetical protein